MTNNIQYDQLAAMLEWLKTFVEQEVHAKQEQINRLQQENDHLKMELEQSQQQFFFKKAQYLQENEGNKQLINKLLGEISTLQNNIEWYKRTYEARSFLGVLKERVKKLSK